MNDFANGRHGHTERFFRAASIVLFVFGAVSPAAAQTAPMPRIDSIFARWDHTNTPGCALGVMKDGSLAYQRGYGMANLDYGIPNSTQMVYYVGSVSKQFTAATVALLVQQGRISLDDDVRKYIPDLPDYGHAVTIRNLIHHTSGVRDIYVLMDLAGIRMEDVFPDEDALALIARQKELNFEPGTDHLYSNSGYWLLGRVVERVTGRSLREIASERIFEPLGMTHSHFHDDPGHVMKNRAVSYRQAGDGGLAVADLSNFDKIGAGGLYTTIEDLLKWDANYYDATVGGPSFLRMIRTRGVLAGGDTLTYAFGNNVTRYRGLPVDDHSGSLMGFRAELLRFPTEHFTVAILCNLSSIAPATLAHRVADIWLGDRLGPAETVAGPAQPRSNTQADAPASNIPLAAYAGSYHSEEVGATYRIEASDGTLVMHRPTHGPIPLQHVSGDTFRGDGLVLEFLRQGRRAVAFTVEAGRVRNIRFDRVQ
jgi:CubicO group peptidase (beta-lactamase class C family)